MRKMIAAVWDRRPGTYHVGRTREHRAQLLKDGYTPAEAERYSKALDLAIGRGLTKRIREAVN